MQGPRNARHLVYVYWHNKYEIFCMVIEIPGALAQTRADLEKFLS